MIQAWAAAGQVAASMSMVWEDRDSVWRKAEVARTDQQMGEAREGIAGGRGEWRVRAEAVTTAILHWLESNANAADQAISMEQAGRSCIIPRKPESGGVSRNGGGNPGVNHHGG